MNIREYFWGLNEKAIKETEKILKNTQHPKFKSRIFTILSRCDNTKEVFNLISKEQFIKTWPEIRRYWMKRNQSPDFRAWWETVYERLLKKKISLQDFNDDTKSIFKYLGEKIKNTRIDKGWSQTDFAQRVGVAQSIISRIERGAIKYSIRTLIRMCKILGIDNINISIKDK